MSKALHASIVESTARRNQHYSLLGVNCAAEGRVETMTIQRLVLQQQSTSSDSVREEQGGTGMGRALAQHRAAQYQCRGVTSRAIQSSLAFSVFLLLSYFTPAVAGFYALRNSCRKKRKTRCYNFPAANISPANIK